MKMFMKYKAHGFPFDGKDAMESIKILMAILPVRFFHYTNLTGNEKTSSPEMKMLSIWTKACPMTCLETSAVQI
jgi:hypothetical protein